MTRSASFTPAPRLLALVAILALPGCVAKTALDVATLPVRAGSKAVDLATTSQSEADEKRGREMRQREERIADLERDYRKHMRQCDQGDNRACLKARDDYAMIQQLSAR